LFAYSRNSPSFIKHEASITGFTRANNWYYPEADEFTPHPNTSSDFIIYKYYILLNISDNNFCDWECPVNSVQMIMVIIPEHSVVISQCMIAEMALNSYSY
jgi:hypothetical protein